MLPFQPYRPTFGIPTTADTSTSIMWQDAAAPVDDNPPGPRATGPEAANQPTTPPASTNNPVPDAAAAAVEAQNRRSDDGKTDSMESTARTFPQLRAFSDHTFVLMHMMNLINLRNEKIETAMDRMEVKKEKHLMEDLKSTLQLLKGENPYAYYPTQMNTADANAIINCYGEPYSFLNYLTAYPGYQEYLNINNEDLSSLAPKIKLYKIFASEGREEAVEISFPTEGISGEELEDLLRSGSKRGYGVGIKSFDCTLDGTNPHTRQTSISATLVLFATSMEELLKPRTGRGTAANLNYRYFDLAMKTDTVPGMFGEPDKDGTFGNLDDLDYRFIAQVGVVENSNVNSIDDQYTSISISLGPALTHNYDIAENGSVTLTIEYRGYIETEYENPIVYDVFATKDTLKMDLYKSMGSLFLRDICGGDLATKFEQHILTAGNNQMAEQATQLVELLRRRGRVYYINLKPDVFESYNKAFGEYEKNLEEIAKAQAPKTKQDKTDEAKNNQDIQKEVDKALNKLHKALGFQSTAARRRNNNTVENNITNVQQEEDLESAVQSREIEGEMDDSKSGQSQEQDTDKQVLNVKRCAINPNGVQVAYFYAGDLINLILEQMSNLYNHESTKEIITEAFELVTNMPTYMEATGGDSKEIPDQTMAKMYRIIDTYSARANRFRKFRMVMGPTEIDDFFTDANIMCSIADIPIPLTHFIAWLAKLVEGQQKTRIGLVSFVNEFVESYMRNMLAGDKGIDQGLLGQIKSYDSTPITGYNAVTLEPGAPPDTLTALRVNYGGRKGLHYQTVPEDYRPIINTHKQSNSPMSKLAAYEYQVYYDKKAPPYLDYTSAAARSKHGIYNYQIGRDKGLVKKITFQRTNTKYMKEARVSQGKYNGLKQLVEVFDINIESFADFNKFPGQRIYLDSKSIVPYLSKETLDSLGDFTIDDFGMGGIYVVLEIKHSLAPGRFDTSLICKWESWITDRRSKENQTYKDENLEFGETIQDPQRGIDDFLAAGAFGGASSNRNQPDKPEDGTARRLCKSTEYPDTGGQDTIQDEFIQGAEKLFGKLEAGAKYLIGYVKGLTDTGPDTELPTDYDIGAAFQKDFQDRRSGRNPDAGNESAANNGVLDVNMSDTATVNMGRKP